MAQWETSTTQSSICIGCKLAPLVDHPITHSYQNNNNKTNIEWKYNGLHNYIACIYNCSGVITSICLSAYVAYTNISMYTMVSQRYTCMRMNNTWHYGHLSYSRVMIVNGLWCIARIQNKRHTTHPFFGGIPWYQFCYSCGPLCSQLLASGIPFWRKYNKIFFPGHQTAYHMYTHVSEQRHCIVSMARTAEYGYCW